MSQVDWVGVWDGVLVLLKAFGIIGAVMLFLGLFSLPRILRHDREVQAYKRRWADEAHYKPPTE